MADTKTDLLQPDASAAISSAQNEAGLPGPERSLIRELSNQTVEPDLSEDMTGTAPSLALSGPGRARGRAQDKVYAGAAASLSRRQLGTRGVGKDPGAARQKLMMGLIPVLAIALVFFVRNPLKVSAVPPAQDAPPDTTASSAGTNTEIDWKIPPLYLPGDRDPMQLPPPVTPEAEKTVGPPAPAQTRIALTVSGILYSQDRPAAIIGTRLVHEGEEISGARVTKIEMDGVEFEMNGQTWKQAVDK